MNNGELARGGGWVDRSQRLLAWERFLDPELTTLARIGQGRCLIYVGQIDEGVALLYEAMVAVGARRSPRSR